MKWPVTLVLLALVMPALAQGTVQPPPAAGAVGPATPLTPAPDDRAKQWLGLLDDQNYDDAYKQMGPTAQHKTTANAFSSNLGAKRSPLGAMASRTIKSIKLSNNLPGMRDGQYATVQFDSSFAHKAQATETVVLASDKGAWSVISYTIN
jgi:Protein of unknown function (DUF4019)